MIVSDPAARKVLEALLKASTEEALAYLDGSPAAARAAA